MARYHAEEAKPVSKTLGELGDAFEFDQAADAARLWFKDIDAGISAQTEQVEATIETACRDYVADRRRAKGDATAHDADKRFQRTVYGDGKKRLRNRIADVPLAKVRSTQFREWRETLVTSGLSKASAWRDVKAFKGAANRRDLFLDLAQRRSLLGEKYYGHLLSTNRQNRILQFNRCELGVAGETSTLTQSVRDERLLFGAAIDASFGGCSNDTNYLRKSACHPILLLSPENHKLHDRGLVTSFEMLSL